MFTVEEQERTVLAALKRSHDDVLIDLQDVTLVSAVGVQMLNYVRCVLARADRRLVLVADDPTLRRQLKTAGLTTLVEVRSSPNAARSVAPG